MATTVYLILILFYARLSICNGLVSVLGVNSVKAKEMEAIPARDCGGKIGQCFGDEMEWEWDWEKESSISSSRRVLVLQKRFISYETLKKDMIPCARPGASYYNCRASGEANPYNRGCEVITGCARDVRDIKS